MIISQSPADTFEYARQLAGQLQPGAVIALTGDLGAGKTCFVKGLARGLDVPHEITSPTFALIHEHGGGRLPLCHIDLYRLDTVEQALAIGIEDYLAPRGVTVIEWAERIAALLPVGTIHIRLTATGETSRQIARA